MNKPYLLGLAVLLALLLVGCVPQQTLFPLYTNQDTLFDKQLLGEWQIWSGDSATPRDKPGLIQFGAANAPYTYDVTVPSFDEEGRSLSSEARLTKLGNFVFIDFVSPDVYKLPQIPYPVLPCHAFGRLTLEKNNARIDFLSDDWVKNTIQAGKLSLAFADISSPVLSASTVDLRRFALEHAEDREAFSETFTLARKD
jgi:hypothetical protein